MRKSKPGPAPCRSIPVLFMRARRQSNGLIAACSVSWNGMGSDQLRTRWGPTSEVTVLFAPSAPQRCNIRTLHHSGSRVCDIRHFFMYSLVDSFAAVKISECFIFPINSDQAFICNL